MAVDDERKLDPNRVVALYHDHADELRRFLHGLLRNGDLAADALQATFTKAIVQGHNVEPGSLKSWLFTVAYREAMLIRRKQGVADRAIEQRKLIEQAGNTNSLLDAVGIQIRRESIELVRAALQELPAEQLEVVRRRIFEEQKFATIAADLSLPLGTVLSRMQLALGKLRKKLSS